MKGYCGEVVDSKEWKQGVSSSCEKSGEKIVTYPNVGLRRSIAKLCDCCQYSPFSRFKEKVDNEPGV